MAQRDPNRVARSRQREHRTLIENNLLATRIDRITGLASNAAVLGPAARFDADTEAVHDAYAMERAMLASALLAVIVLLGQQRRRIDLRNLVGEGSHDEFICRRFYAGDGLRVGVVLFDVHAWVEIFRHRFLRSNE
jgi:hypothetical protein